MLGDVSPVGGTSDGGCGGMGGDLSCGSLVGEEDSGAVMLMSDTRSESSACSTTPLNTLYQEICDQKDVIMACLEEDKCDIDQVRKVPYGTGTYILYRYGTAWYETMTTK
jgi:hypothetical protein